MLIGAGEGRVGDGGSREGKEEGGREGVNEGNGEGREGGTCVRPIPVNLFPLFTQLSGRSDNVSFTSTGLFFSQQLFY